MNLELSDEQRLLADTARAFVDRHADDADPWPAMRDTGWAGLLVPEEHGGSGAGMTEFVLVCEALGRGPVVSPLIPSVTAALALRWAGTPDLQDQWLPTLATGAFTGTVAVLEAGMRDEWSPAPMSGLGALTGTKVLVPWVPDVAVIVVVTSEGLRVVERSGAVRVHDHDPLCAEPHAALTFQQAPAERLGSTADSAVVLARVLDYNAVARLAYAIGAAERALELSVDHATNRHQFGRPIGTFQAVAHRCAEMRADVDACRYLAYRAAWALDHDADAAIAVTAAKSFANDAMRRVFLHAHQVHGAMGFATEHELHRYTRVAKSFELSLGGTTRHRDRLATEIGLGSRP
ncbi:MAG: acyl-CoA dehydrogenase [Actinobacteria bacterium]|nr:acyl-CoA dehydrogenase [Actinomycetota bacterium]